MPRRLQLLYVLIILSSAFLGCMKKYKLAEDMIRRSSPWPFVHQSVQAHGYIDDLGHGVKTTQVGRIAQQVVHIELRLVDHVGQ